MKIMMHKQTWRTNTHLSATAPGVKGIQIQTRDDPLLFSKEPVTFNVQTGLFVCCTEPPTQEHNTIGHSGAWTRNFLNWVSGTRANNTLFVLFLLRDSEEQNVNINFLQQIKAHTDLTHYQHENRNVDAAKVQLNWFLATVCYSSFFTR